MNLSQQEYPGPGALQGGFVMCSWFKAVCGTLDIPPPPCGTRLPFWVPHTRGAVGGGTDWGYECHPFYIDLVLYVPIFQGERTDKGSKVSTFIKMMKALADVTLVCSWNKIWAPFSLALITVYVAQHLPSLREPAQHFVSFLLPKRVFSVGFTWWPELM